MRYYIDSNIFIYVLTGQKPYYKQSRALMEYIEKANSVNAVSSVLILGEILGSSNNSKINDIKDFIEKLNNLSLLVVDKEIAVRAGELRSSNKSLKLPDGIHLASAINYNATLVTADTKLLAIAKKYTPVLNIKDYF